MKTTLFDTWQVKDLIMVAGQVYLELKSLQVSSNLEERVLLDGLKLIPFIPLAGADHFRLGYLTCTTKGIFCYNN